MDRTAGNLIDVTWVAWAAERLREQWPRIDGATLEETARDLWRDEELRVLGPRQAVEKWLRRGIPGKASHSMTRPNVQTRPAAGSSLEAR